ncbi:hypothetical protein JCM10212_002392 [Sporobolomyces blumeae]
MSLAVRYEALPTGTPDSFASSVASPAASTLYSRKDSFDPDAELLLRDSRQRRNAPRPRGYRCLRLSAVAGWTLVIFLLVVLAGKSERIRDKIDVVRHHPYAHKLLGSTEADKDALGREASVSPKKMTTGIRKPVTIVSSFYRIETGKKHRVSEYHDWMTNFLGSVELPIIFYCAPTMAAEVRHLRGAKPITIITDYSSPFEMPPLLALGGLEWAKEQYKVDPEQKVHVPEVYGVWTAKPWIVRDASERDPYDSEFFFWVDAGSFRDSTITHDFSALPAVLDKTFDPLPRDTILLAATTKPFEPGLDFVKSAKPGKVMDREDRLQGGWFGGRKEGVEMWDEAVKEVTIRQSAMRRFAGKEQPVWTQAARLKWDKIYVQNMALRTGTDCGDDLWFGFEYFADGRDCDIPVWNGPEYAKEGVQGFH